MKVALTIAGSDSSGGAGIQADIKTMTANGVYAMSAITALTAQNTLGVQDILSVPEDFLREQLDSCISDIYPDSVKIGMIKEASLIKLIAERLSFYKVNNIIVDPVMVSTSGSSLSSDGAINALKTTLLPISTLVTPNIPEAEVLAECSIKNQNEMEKAAESISKKYNCSVLLKGGHNLQDANDFLYNKNGSSRWFYGERIENPNTHGTGCTLSSAIASNLAKGETLENAIEKAKKYISGALKSMLNLGKGRGPMNHAFNIKDFNF